MQARSASSLALLAALVLGAGTAHAQSLRGTVVLPDNTTPARGVIVMAMGDAGAMVARTLTGERGDFLLTVRPAGRYSLKVLRIGFRPTTVPPLEIGTGTNPPVRIVLTNDPITLSAVNIRATDECRVNPDSGLMVARVWDEARKAIMTSQLTSDDAPLFAEWIQYDRVLDPGARFVREQNVRSARNATTHAFKSKPAEFLASNGYVIEDSIETMFYAPDADVLTSESFASSHCLRLVAPPRDRPALIGVGFEPVVENGGVRDIAGTFWVDRASSELRSLEFRYTGLGDVSNSAKPGGLVEFLRLANGNWLVSRWNVRMPRLGVRDLRADNFARQQIFSSTRGAVTAVNVSGGEVGRVMRRDTVLYQAEGYGLTLKVVTRDSLVPAPGARLTLVGTDYKGTADAQGFIMIHPVLEGQYIARVRSALMDSLDMPPIEREVEVRSDTHVDSLSLPSSRDVLVKVCTSDSVKHGEGMLRGAVRDSHGHALKQAAVTVTWQSVAAQGTAAGFTVNEQTVGVLTDDAGLWRICGIPRDVVLATRVVSDSGSDYRSLKLDGDHPFGAVDLVARQAAVEAGAKPASARALVEFAVYALGGGALPGATLEVSAPGGATRSIVTGASGRALMPDVAPGKLQIRAKRIGFKAGQIVATIEAGRNTIPIILSDVLSPTLDTMRIVGDRRSHGRYDEFDTRRANHSATASFNRDDIEKVNPVDTWQMLSRVNAMHLLPQGGALIPISNRGSKIGMAGTTVCAMVVMIDGIVMQGNVIEHDTVGTRQSYDVQQLPPPDQIYGIEVFAGGSSIPVQYGGSGNNKYCGMIAIWTR